jgi:hypothetical protein
MTYAINGVTLTAQPEAGDWKDREKLGDDGNGRPIYPRPREFEMKWGFISMSDWNQLNTFFQSVGATGTVTVDLPKYGGTSWQFQSYSGCILSEPIMGQYFEEYISEVRLVVSKITT